MNRREFIKIGGATIFGGLIINPFNFFNNKFLLSDIKYETDTAIGMPIIEEHFNNGKFVEVVKKLKELFVVEVGGFNSACITNPDFAKFANNRYEKYGKGKWIKALCKNSTFQNRLSHTIWAITYTDRDICMLINKDQENYERASSIIPRHCRSSV